MIEVPRDNPSDSPLSRRKALGDEPNIWRTVDQTLNPDPQSTPEQDAHKNERLTTKNDSGSVGG